MAFAVLFWTARWEDVELMGLIEVIAACSLVVLVLTAGLAAVIRKHNPMWLLLVAGVLLLGLFAVHRGDPALLTGVGGLFEPLSSGAKLLPDK